jgi:hypothetical protein
MSNLEKKIKSDLNTITYHFNTKFRRNYYKNPSTRCELPFLTSEKLKAITLQSICIPNCWYVFSDLLENNKFIVQFENTTTESLEVLEVVIPEGNYTPDELTHFLNQTYFYESGRTYGFVKVKICINKHTLKTSFHLVNTQIEENLKFHLIFIDKSTSSIMSTCGWLLGFRYGKYFNIKDEVYSEGLFDGGGDRYIYFCLLNSELEDTHNKHIILLDNQRNHPKSSTVLAKISLKNGKFALQSDNSPDNVLTYKKTLILKNPKSLESLQINLLDQYGQEIFLNNMDFSFSIECIKNQI